MSDITEEDAMCGLVDAAYTVLCPKFPTCAILTPTLDLLRVDIRTAEIVIPRLSMAQFRISLLPGNGRVLIFHGAEVDVKFRGLGLGRRLHEMRLEIARLSGAHLCLATVNKNNTVQERIMKSHGWTRSYSVGDAFLWVQEIVK